MKVLHTSDWHLGQSFFTQSRKQEHQAFLTWLLEQVSRHQVDAVIVAGDIFDTGTPPSYAREMYNQFVVDLHRANCALLILGGNHDSVAVLNESRQLLSQLNTFVVASTGVPEDDQILELHSQNRAPGAVVCAIPFIRPKDVLQSNAGETGAEKRQALGEAIKQHYQRIYDKARARANELGVPVIATGHLTALGVSQSESVRDIYIGTLEGFAADGFPPADYIALGHIHRPQKVAGRETIRYSGSPIPLSFDELSKPKEVLLVHFEGRELQSVSPLEIPRFQPMQVIRGNVAQIEQTISEIGQSEQTQWLCVEVDTDEYLTDLQNRIQQVAQQANVEVLQLKRVRSPQRQALRVQNNETLAELTPEDVFEKRLANEDLAEDEKESKATRLRELFAEVTNSLQGGEGE